MLMDKRMPKNAMCFVGSTNCGKTIIMADRLIAIAKFCGRFTNAATSGKFAWQSCTNQRMISVEEAVFAAEHLEKLKQIAGGETCTVDHKHMSGVTLLRTPSYDNKYRTLANKL